MEAFREVLLHDLTEDQFADMYAQTICYGLFADLTHYQHIVSALNETIRLISDIDHVIEEHSGWPIK